MEIPPNYTTEEHEGRPLSLRQGLQPASVQFTGKIDGVRQNETLAPVRYPQISLFTNAIQILFSEIKMKTTMFERHTLLNTY